MSVISAVHVTCDVRVVDPPTIPVERFHERGTALMDALAELEEGDPEIVDATLAGDAGTKVWTIDMLVRTDDNFEAVVKALAVIRTALHALGDATPGWPTADEVRSSFTPSDVQTERVLVDA